MSHLLRSKPTQGVWRMICCVSWSNADPTPPGISFDSLKDRLGLCGACVEKVAGHLNPCTPLSQAQAFLHKPDLHEELLPPFPLSFGGPLCIAPSSRGTAGSGDGVVQSIC